MTAEQAAARQAAHENLLAELIAALSGCVDHMEWSTAQGRMAYRQAVAVLARARGE